MRARMQATRFGARLFTGRAVDRARARRGPDEPAPGRPTTAASSRPAPCWSPCGVDYRRLGVAGARGARRAGRLLRRRDERRARDGRAATCSSSAAATRPGRPRSTSPGSRARVTIVVRRPGLAETMSAYLVNEIATQRRGSACDRAPAGRRRRGRRATSSGSTSWTTRRHVERVAAGGLFLLLGADPGCGWLPDEVARDERGFVLTGRDIPRTGGATGCHRRRWRPRCRASSRRATCGPAR